MVYRGGHATMTTKTEVNPRWDCLNRCHHSTLNPKPRVRSLSVALSFYGRESGSSGLGGFGNRVSGSDSPFQVLRWLRGFRVSEFGVEGLWV